MCLKKEKQDFTNRFADVQYKKEQQKYNYMYANVKIHTFVYLFIGFTLQSFWKIF